MRSTRAGQNRSHTKWLPASKIFGLGSCLESEPILVETRVPGNLPDHQFHRHRILGGSPVIIPPERIRGELSFDFIRPPGRRFSSRSFLLEASDDIIVLDAGYWAGSEPTTLKPIILDLSVAPDGKYMVPDEDEFAEAVSLGHLTSGQVLHARSVLEELVQATERGDFPPAVVKEFQL